MLNQEEKNLVVERKERMATTWAFVVVAVVLLAPASCFWFDLPSNGEKCFFEEMVQDIMVGDTNGDFSFGVRVLFSLFLLFFASVFDGFVPHR